MNDLATDETAIAPEFDELATLKKRADLMGITYHPSIGLDKLKLKLNSKLNEVHPEEKENIKSLLAEPVPYLTHAQYTTLMAKDTKRKASSLIRINVTCRNPNKNEWPGEIISVGSAKLGTFKKFVPFNGTEGWHVPYIIYEAMKERKCSIFSTVKDRLGNKIRKARLVNEFNIEVLPNLTKEELKNLAQRQAMSGSVGEQE